MAGIDFSKFSQDFKAKFEKAIADKKIYAEEFQEFSAEDQAELSRQLANTPGHIGDIIVIQNAYKSKQGTLEFYAGADSQEGKIELSQDTISKYPNAGKFGNFNKGVVTILDKDGKVLKDSLGNSIKFDFSTDLEIDSAVDNVQGGFEAIEGENFQRTNRRFAIALIHSMYDKVIVENQKMLEQLGLLNASLWREGLGMGIQKIADSIDADQKAITATTAKKIEQMVEERDKICDALEKQLDNPSGFSDEFSKLVGSNFSDMNFDKLRETCHNKENEKDDTIRYNKTVEDFNEMYPDNKITKYLEGNFVTKSLDKMVKLCDSVADILVMFWTTGGIGGTLGKASMKGFANCSKFFIKDICEKNYKEAIAQLPKLSSFMAGAAHSAPTMSTFEGGKALINSATNGEDLTADEILSRTIDGFIGGAEMGVEMAGLQTFAIAPIMNKLSPVLGKMTGASSKIKELLKKNGEMSLEDISKVYDDCIQTTRGKIAQEGLHLGVSLPVMVPGFTGIDSAKAFLSNGDNSYNEDNFREQLLHNAKTQEERVRISAMNSFELKVEFVKRNFQAQLEGMTTIEGVSLALRRFQAARLAGQAVPKPVNNLLGAKIKTVEKDGKPLYEVVQENGKTLKFDMNDGKTVSKFSSPERAIAAYQAMCVKILNEFKAELEKADNTPQPNTQGAREQNSVHVDKNADGTFNVKDGDYYWHVKNTEELSFVTDYLSQRKDLSGMLIKEKVRDDGSKLIKEVDPQTGKSVRTTKVNSDGSIEYITFYEHKNGVTTKSVELYSDKAFVTDYRISNGKYQASKETEIYSNGQKDVTVYDSYGKVEEKYSIPNVELVVNKDGSYVSEENIDILMQKFGITDRNEAAMLLENVIDCGVNDRFLRILTNLNDTNKKIILPLVKNNKTAYIAYNVMENVNATNKDVLEFVTKNLNIDELQLFDLSRLVDEVNASRILNALKEGKDLRSLSRSYSDFKRIYDPIIKKMDSTNKVEYIQKEIDSFEQDLSKITNEPVKYTDLFELKLQNKDNYDKILNSGLIEVLDNGTVKNVEIPRLANADLTPEIYSDLKLLKEGKSIVKEFSADTDIKEAYKATSIGDVVEVGEQMYINDGKKLAKWKMTKEMFLKLFPPVDRFAFKQKNLGDCYLLSSISSVMRNKKASVTFYQSFEYDGKDVKVTVKAYEDYNGSQTFTNGELSNLGKKQVEACRGVQLYERTYAKVALREQDIIYPNTAESKALMQRIEGGNSSQAIQEILGTKAINYDDAKSDMMIEKSISIPYKRNSASTVNVELEQFNSKGIQDILNNFKENQPNTSIALYLGNSKNIKTVIDYLANNDNIILNFGTKHDLKLTDILKKQHAYSVCGYNKSTGIVKVVDPHNNSNIKEIHIDELSKLTNTIYITNLAK